MLGIASAKAQQNTFGDRLRHTGSNTLATAFSLPWTPMMKHESKRLTNVSVTRQIRKLGRELRR
jgi:hypothetical protein